MTDQTHPSSAPSQPSSSNEATATSTTRDASSLPPEAIELATKLFDHARAGSTTSLQPYVQAGIPPNLTNGTGDTLLMLAAYHGHAETVSMLLDAGADANALNDRGQSPLAGSVFKGYMDVVRVLVEKGHADVNAGHPNAVDCAKMFKRNDLLAILEGSQAVNGNT
ncbi:ankyrin [Microthyrium microscopicum]|uniref:Ankyrin n=1 Tax=Microthyrium microscopicum TaxID=703497 RepID=A0A6A6U033_9PEZI|nr:ankyrin [Microthyrium microscopicum]